MGVRGLAPLAIVKHGLLLVLASDTQWAHVAPITPEASDEAVLTTTCKWLMFRGLGLEISSLKTYNALKPCNKQEARRETCKSVHLFSWKSGAVIDVAKP